MKLLFLFLLPFLTVRLTAADRPNIVLIYADDLGYGDVSVNGAIAVRTPEIDRIAAEGINFTSAYCTSATCTPSRYSLLTGEYAWRREGTGILPGDAALIIDPARPTLPAMLKKAGYRTGVVGKWHLGLGAVRGSDWNAPMKPGANETGFDFSHIMAATGDRVPCVFVENGEVVRRSADDPIRVSYQKNFPGEPDGITHRAELTMDWSHGHNNAVINGIGRIGFMTGGKDALWRDEEIADHFAAQAVQFIRSAGEQPFFLYYALHDIHVPRVPHPRFTGKTSMGPRGDAIVQTDWQVGEILRTLEELKHTENTLVIFTSDNGPVLDDGYKDGAAVKVGDHKPAGPFRGGKYSLFEGGTRVCTMLRWPARIKAGQTSGALVSQIDFAASLGALTGQGEVFPDSSDQLPALLGEDKQGRKFVVEHAGRLALRAGDWKLIPGGRGAAKNAATATETGNAPGPQLYNLSKDPGETVNVAAEHPDKVRELEERLASVRR